VGFDCSIAVLELWLDAGSVLFIHFVLQKYFENTKNYLHNTPARYAVQRHEPNKEQSSIRQGTLI
jgi:hypothetical protein